MITVQECIDLMAAAKVKVEKTTVLKEKVEKTVAAVKQGDKAPEKGALEIAKAVENAPAEVPVETKKAANNVARKVLYQEDLTETMKAFERIVNAELAKLEEEILSIKEDIKKLQENDAKQDETIDALSVVVVKNTTDIEKLKKEQRNIYGFVTLGLSTAVNTELVNMSLGIGLGLPFKYFTVEAGVEGGFDLTSNNLTTVAHAGMIFLMKDWVDKGSIHFIVRGLFYSVIKLPEDNVNTSLMGLGYYGGGGLAVRYLLPVGKAELLFQSGFNGLYGEGRDRTATGWKRVLEPVVEIDLFKFGVLF